MVQKNFHSSSLTHSNRFLGGIQVYMVYMMTKWLNNHLFSHHFLDTSACLRGGKRLNNHLVFTSFPDTSASLRGGWIITLFSHHFWTRLHVCVAAKRLNNHLVFTQKGWNNHLVYHTISTDTFSIYFSQKDLHGSCLHAFSGNIHSRPA